MRANSICCMSLKNDLSSLCVTHSNLVRLLRFSLLIFMWAMDASLFSQGMEYPRLIVLSCSLVSVELSALDGVSAKLLSLGSVKVCS